MAKAKVKKKKVKKSKLEEKLKLKRKTGWKDLSSKKEKEIYKYCEDYKNFLILQKQRKG